MLMLITVSKIQNTWYILTCPHGYPINNYALLTERGLKILVLLYTPYFFKYARVIKMSCHFTKYSLKAVLKGQVNVD